MQIGALGYPDVVLSQEQITRCLEAYLMWLFGKVMFTESHVDTISARFISIAREIAEAQQLEDIVPRSFGSAVLAATYRSLCTVCTKNAEPLRYLAAHYCCSCGPGRGSLLVGRTSTLLLLGSTGSSRKTKSICLHLVVCGRVER